MARTPKRSVKCQYCGEVVQVKAGRAVPHEDFFPTRWCEGGNLVVGEDALVPRYHRP